MKNSVNLLVLFISIGAIALGVVNLINKSDCKVIRFVRSQELIYGFEGMQDAMAQFEARRQVRIQDLDTLASDYQATLGRYQREGKEMSNEDRKAIESLLQSQANNYQAYQARIQADSEEEERQLLEGVLAQINSFSKQYAEEQDIDLIYGTTDDGNILYGKEELDITSPLLEALNRHYQDQ